MLLILGPRTGPAGERPIPRSPGILAVVLIGLLLLDMGLAWMVTQAAYVYVDIVWHALASKVFPGITLAEHSRQFRLLRLAQVAAWLVTAILFTAWLYRVDQNLWQLGETLRYSPREAVRSVLVPGPNLVRPFLVMREIWHATGRGEGGKPLGSGAWVAWWWLTLIGALCAEAATGGLAESALLPLDLGGALQLLILAQALEIAAGALGIVVVRRISARQRELLTA